MTKRSYCYCFNIYLYLRRKLNSPPCSYLPKNILSLIFKQYLNRCVYISYEDPITQEGYPSNKDVTREKFIR